MEKRKRRDVLWLIGLIILSFPVGFVFIVAFYDKAFCDPLILNLIIGGIAMVVDLGLLALLVRYLARKWNSRDANKAALRVYSFFLAIFAIAGIIGLPSGLLNKCGIFLF